MAEPGTVRRIVWFVGLWLAGVLALGVVGLIIKFWLGT
jgi:Protein of unknown function (DUF2474).